MLDDQQAATALVVRSGLSRQRGAGVAVSDQDSQLTLAEGEDQPDA